MALPFILIPKNLLHVQYTQRFFEVQLVKLSPLFLSQVISFEIIDWEFKGGGDVQLAGASF